MDIIDGLLRLEALSSYKNTGPEAELLARNYHLVQNPFDYFLECLMISRNIPEEGACPSESNVIYFTMGELLGNPDSTWMLYKNNCHACNHKSRVYQHLIENIWQALGDTKSYVVANIILAYLRNEPESVSNLFKALEKMESGEYRELHDADTRHVKGILTISENTQRTCGKKYWHGLVRRAVDVMGSTMCTMCPKDSISPVFRVDFSNDLENFYFLLVNGKPETARGLRFDFSGSDLNFLSNDCFVASVTGTGHDESPKNKWEAIFYGKIS